MRPTVVGVVSLPHGRMAIIKYNCWASVVYSVRVLREPPLQCESHYVTESAADSVT